MTEEFDFGSDFAVDGKISSSKQGIVMGSLETMPTPSEEYEGFTVQYTGPDSLGGYVKDTIYKCEKQADDTYAWVSHNPAGGGGGEGGPTVYLSDATYDTATEILKISKTNSGSSSVVVQIDLSAKQDSLTQAQLDAANSGVTSVKVSGYDSHIASTSNPHNVTKDQLGLGSVDNTSDVNKPISTAMQNALNNKQNISVGTADVVLVTDTSGKISASSVQSSKLAYISTLSSDAQTQLDNKVSVKTGYDLAKITFNGAVTTAPSFWALTAAGTEDSYIYWDNTTKSLTFKQFPNFIKVMGNKTGDELNSMVGTTVGELYVCTVDSTTAPNKYKDTAYYWTSDNEWAIFCKTTIDLSKYLEQTSTIANVVMITDGSKKIIPSSSITTTKLGYLSDVTSNIQGQLDAKQGALSTDQLSACNSGINATKRSAYDTHVSDGDIHVTATEKSAWDGKQDALPTDDPNKYVYYDGTTKSFILKEVTISVGFSDLTGNPDDNSLLKSALAAKQGTLSTAQLEACNSGITATDKSNLTSHLSATDIHVTTSDKSKWNGYETTKQAVLVGSGTGQNIKTVGGTSLLGTGDIPIVTTDWTSTTLAPSASEILTKIREHGSTFRGRVDTVADLATITGMDINDRAIVTTDVDHDNKTSWYIYAQDGTTLKWVWEYNINDTSWSTTQLNAINSGITADKVSSYDTHLASGNIHVTSTEKATWNGKVDANTDLATVGTFCKITFDKKGLVTAGANLEASDIPDLAVGKVNAMTGYAIAASAEAITVTDTLSVAIGKLEYKVDNVGSAIKLTGYAIATSASDIAATDTFNQAIGKLEYEVKNPGPTAKMTGYATASAATAITVTDTLNAAIGKLEYKIDNGGASSKLTGYAIATAASAVDATDTTNSAIAKIEYRLKQLEDANLVRYS